MRPPERTTLLAALTGAMIAGVATLLALRHERLVGWPAISLIAVPWMSLSIALRLRADTWGKERPVVDWWSVPHVVAGVLFGLLGVGGVLVAMIALVWECVELASRVYEYPTNRAVDVVLAISGWGIANLAAGGPFAAW